MMLKQWSLIIFWALAIPFLIGILVHDAKANPVIPAFFNNVLSMPIVVADDRFYEAYLVCDDSVKNCKVVRVREICNPELTNFSPSVICAETLK